MATRNALIFHLILKKEKMMLEQLYYIAELVGVIAIVGSMLFVGIQMRQNTQAMKISAGQGMIASWGQSNRDIISDPGFAEIMAPLLGGTANIPEGADGLRVRLWTQNVTREGEQNYYNWVAGALEERSWKQVQANGAWLLSTRAGRVIWSEIKGDYGDEFVAVMDGFVEQMAPS